MNEKDFQTSLLRYIHSPGTGVAMEQSLQEIIAAIKPNPKLSPESALEIYQNDYFFRHLEAFKHFYPCLHMLLEEAEFQALFHFYLQHNKMVFSNLNQFGENLLWLLDHYPNHPDVRELSDEYPFLRDLVNFEKHYWDFFNADKEAVHRSFENEQFVIHFKSNFRLLGPIKSVHHLYPYRHKHIQDFLIQHRPEVLTESTHLLFMTPYHQTTLIQVEKLTREEVEIFYELNSNPPKSFEEFLDIKNISSHWIENWLPRITYIQSKL